MEDSLVPGMRVRPISVIKHATGLAPARTIQPISACVRVRAMKEAAKRTVVAFSLGNSHAMEVSWHAEPIAAMCESGIIPAIELEHAAISARTSELETMLATEVLLAMVALAMWAMERRTVS